MKYSYLDKFILQFDSALRTLFAENTAQRPFPAENEPIPALSEAERMNSIAKMRVNHAGEVCAQALYQGQACSAHSVEVRESMQQAAREETDHLAWCEQRLVELGGHTSYLNPFWYTGSLLIGTVAAWVGDRWSLGFVAETERQVVTHLQGHLQSCSPADLRTRVVIAQMMDDENQHAYAAQTAGGAALPSPIPTMMSFAAKIMTTTAFYI